MSSSRTYGRYILDERIAMGGMAEIFRARTATEGFEKLVCIKRVLPHFLENEAFVTMFRDEAALAARLQHGNIVQMFDFGEEEGALYLAMELVDGLDLRKYLDRAHQRGKPLGIGQAVQIAIEMCRGLHHAHTLSDRSGPLHIVHRDVSPHNVLISRNGEVKITDFGIAKASERATHTSTGVVKGKLSYMAPEQAEGANIDHRVDQFATGIVLWEMLTGVRLFSGENEASILRKLLVCDVPAPSTVRREIPEPLERVVMQALSADRDQRFADMRAFEMALHRVLFALSSDPSFSDVRAWVESLLVEEIAPRRTLLMESAPDMPGVEPAVTTEEDASATITPEIRMAVIDAPVPTSVSSVFTSKSDPKKILADAASSEAAITMMVEGSLPNLPHHVSEVAASTAATRTVMPVSSMSVDDETVRNPPSVVDDETLPAPVAPGGAPLDGFALQSFETSSEPVAFPKKTPDEAVVPTERVTRPSPATMPRAAPSARISRSVAAGGAVVIAVVVGAFFLRPTSDELPLEATAGARSRCRRRGSPHRTPVVKHRSAPDRPRPHRRERRCEDRFRKR